MSVPRQNQLFYYPSSKSWIVSDFYLYIRTGSLLANERKRAIRNSRLLARNIATMKVVTDERSSKRKRSFSHSSRWRGIHVVYGLWNVILVLSLNPSLMYNPSERKSRHYPILDKCTSPHTLFDSSRCMLCNQSLRIISEYEYMQLCPRANPDSVSLSQEWSYRMKMRPQHESLGSNLFELRSERDVVLHQAIIAAIGRLPGYNLAGEGSGIDGGGNDPDAWSTTRSLARYFRIRYLDSRKTDAAAAS